MRKELERLKRDIESSASENMTKPKRGVLAQAKASGRDRIVQHDRVWNTDLLNSFKSLILSDTGGEKLYRIINEAEYAAAHNYGVDGGGGPDGFSAPPPPENLMPWVSAHMYAFPGMEPEEAAEALSHSLYEDGLSGIFFMTAVRGYLEEHGERDLAKMIENDLRGRRY